MYYKSQPNNPPTNQTNNQSINKSIYLPRSVNIYLSIYLSIYLLSFFVCLFLSIYLSIYLRLFISIYLSIYLCPSWYLLFCLSLRFDSISLSFSIPLSIYLSLSIFFTLYQPQHIYLTHFCPCLLLLSLSLFLSLSLCFSLSLSIYIYIYHSFIISDGAGYPCINNMDLLIQCVSFFLAESFSSLLSCPFSSKSVYYSLHYFKPQQRKNTKSNGSTSIFLNGITRSVTTNINLVKPRFIFLVLIES